MIEEGTAFLKSILENEFAVGGVTTVVVGAGLALLRSVPGKISDWMLRTFTTTVDILDREEAFHWMRVWLPQHLMGSSERRISLIVRHSDPDPMSRDIIFAPAPGSHWTMYGRRPMIATLTRRQLEGAFGNTIEESFQLRIFSRKTDLLRRLIDDAKRLALRPRTTHVDVKIGNPNGYWSNLGATEVRKLDTVVIDEKVKADLMVDMDEFLTSTQWYADRGIPYRRGYLLHGPPGSGKTSLVRGIACELQSNLYLIDLADVRINDITLQELMATIPPKSILLIEDVDRVLEEREAKPAREMKTRAVGEAPPDTEEKDEKPVSYAGLLNAIDGVLTSPGRILFMTTNHMEKLDEALLRPGRIDMKIEVPHPSSNEIARFFEKMYGRCVEAESIRSNGVGSLNLSMADVQHACLRNKTNPEAAYRAILSRESEHPTWDSGAAS